LTYQLIEIVYYDGISLLKVTSADTQIVVSLALALIQADRMKETQRGLEGKHLLGILDIPYGDLEIFVPAFCLQVRLRGIAGAGYSESVIPIHVEVLNGCCRPLIEQSLLLRRVLVTQEQVGLGVQDLSRELRILVEEDLP
jgi:hypothetical protein